MRIRRRSNYQKENLMIFLNEGTPIIEEVSTEHRLLRKCFESLTFYNSSMAKTEACIIIHCSKCGLKKSASFRMKREKGRLHKFFTGFKMLFFT